MVPDEIKRFSNKQQKGLENNKTDKVYLRDNNGFIRHLEILKPLHEEVEYIGGRSFTEFTEIKNLSYSVVWGGLLGRLS